MQKFRIVMAVFVCIIFFINCVFMLISPIAWFRLPGWIGFHGTMTGAKYGTRAVRFQVRVLGAIGLGYVFWGLYGFFSH
jgi:hypothetical protein